MTAAAALRARLKSPPIVVAPGCYDALSALLVERAGFACAYLSGASIAYTRFARPDIGLVSLKEVADTVEAIRSRVALPLLVDADTGFGNALNVRRTVELLERCGATGLQLEDQSFPKRCGHLQGKSLIPAGEMVGKLKAALDARASADTLIVARTDAVAVEGFDAALERAERYVEAGADMLFVEAPEDRAHMQSIADRFRGRVPVMANMVEGGKTPVSDAADLERLGFAFVIFPGGLVRFLARTAEEYLASLKAHGTTLPFKDRMHDFQGLNAVIGTPDMLALGARYDGAKFER
ncbi:MAG: oxaloacetate decarboxylase [Alphaproteobacteria bacterium]|nr:oxaloacetate decarboxylase [Alphaproteobacteria bacterium]